MSDHERLPDASPDATQGYARPYATPAGLGFAEHMPAERNSGLGIASFVIGLLAGLGLVGLFGYAVFLAQTIQGNPSEHVLMLLGLGVIGCAMLFLVGLVLGAIGLFQSGRRKLFPVLGVVVNGMAVVATVAIVAIGFKGQS